MSISTRDTLNIGPEVRGAVRISTGPTKSGWVARLDQCHPVEYLFISHL